MSTAFNTTPADPAASSQGYLVLFRGGNWDRGLSPEEIQQVMTRVVAWFDQLHASGHLRAAQPLDTAGWVIRGKSGGQPITDGPYAETKEGIAGYLILNADSLESAVALARSCPTLAYDTSIEVRPVAHECPHSRLAKEAALQ